MKALPIVQFGKPVLRQITPALTTAEIKSPLIQKLIPLMFYTMREIGVGLAAPQVGLPLRMAVIEVKSLAHRDEVEKFPKTVVINPVITKHSKKQTERWEGCLSLKGVAAKALRSEWIKVKYTDEKGKLHEQKFTGFTAQVFQHEIDHLNGVLYVDRIKDMKTLVSTDHEGEE